MNATIRPLRLPDDYEGIAKLLCGLWAEPTTAQRLEDDDRKMYQKGHTYLDEKGRLGGYDRLRLVAVTEQGDIIGYVLTWRAPWTEPGNVNHTLIVDAEHRGNGIGGLLLQQSVDWARQLGASAIVTEVWDDDSRSLDFARNKGFMVERHTYQSVLDLRAPDAADRVDATVLHSLEEQAGISFTTLAEMPGEETERLLHELYKETMFDIPGFTGEVPDIEQWRNWYLKVDGYAPERVIIALQDERVVGVTNVLHNRESGGMYHEYTGVSRMYRGRRVATGLKMKAIQLALSHGAAYIRTDNDSMNAPILRINRKLGYEPLRGTYRIYCPLNRETAERMRG